MIIHDKQVDGWSHLVSTLFGIEGHNELMAFATKIGLNPRWIQNKGGHDEHFDVKRGKYFAALNNGSTEVSRRIMGQTMIDKREQAESIDN